MTQSPAHPPAHLVPESFMAVVWRRTRYTAAVAVSALVFCWLGWMVARPPGDWGGVSLITWHSQHLLAPFVLALLLLLATGICTLLVHPDAPHMGLFCALAGMAGLSIRGGPIYEILCYAQLMPNGYKTVSRGMAIECAEWAIILLIAEAFGRILHQRYFSNIHWITRSAPDVHLPRLDTGEIQANPSQIAKSMGTDSLQRGVGTPVAMGVSIILALGMLYLLMKTQLKGQVLMACFVSFFVSTAIAYNMVPRAPLNALLVAVLLTGAVAYLYGAGYAVTVPGHAPFFAARALPIDYMTAGVPGAILGYYTSFRMSLRPHEG